MFVSNGTVYGIPRDQSPLVLYYNPKMFKQAGISGPPKTWAELLADAKKLTNPAKKVYGIVIYTAGAALGAQFVYQAGGSVMNNSDDPDDTQHSGCL